MVDLSIEIVDLPIAWWIVPFVFCVSLPGRVDEKKKITMNIYPSSRSPIVFPMKSHFARLISAFLRVKTLHIFPHLNRLNFHGEFPTVFPTEIPMFHD